MNPDYLIPLQKVSNCQKILGGVRLEVDDEQCEIVYLKSDLIKIRISQGGKFLEKPSEACIQQDFSFDKITLGEEKNSLKITGTDLIVKVCKDPFTITIQRLDGSSILSPVKDKPFYQFQNNHFVVNRHCQANDHIYGLGEKTGHLDRHGKSFTLWNKDVLAPDPDKQLAELIKNREKNPLDTDFDPYYMSIPFYYKLDSKTLTASGHFIDNPHWGNFHFNNSKYNSHIQIHFSGGQYCEYFFSGPKIRDILKNYTDLSGRMERPPVWALGYHQCRWKKYNQEELLKLAENQRASGVPCDVLWLDIDYMYGYRVFTWNEELFPDRKKLFAELQELGFRVITIVDPGIKYEKGYKIFDEAQEAELLCKCENGQLYVGQVWPGKTVFPDFSQRRCRDWWGKHNGALLEQGIAGIWNDMNEPATGNIEHMPMRFAGENGMGSFSHDRYHNEYALLMAKATVSGLKEFAPNLRTFVLSRGGSAGIQRYAANWLGDNASRWDHLKMSLPMALGVGMSGQPFIGADIGGFVQPTQPELFIRWIQCGAFTPFCRNHNDDVVDQYVWSFGEGVREICEKYIKWRYRLLPYIYSQFVKSTKSGLPVQIPLILKYQDDPACRQIEDEFLLGDDILVAPILTEGATSRQVYFPEGEWFSPEDEKFYCGKKWYSVPAAIDRLPWFIRCGAIIPLYKDDYNSTMKNKNNELRLLCAVPEISGTYESSLIEDDGLTYDYAKGIEKITNFTLMKDKSFVSIKSHNENINWHSPIKNISLLVHSARSLNWSNSKTAGNTHDIILPNREEFFIKGQI